MNQALTAWHLKASGFTMRTPPARQLPAETVDVAPMRDFLRAVGVWIVFTISGVRALHAHVRSV
jgi:hypothetical protein